MIQVKDGDVCVYVTDEQFTKLASKTAEIAAPVAAQLIYDHAKKAVILSLAGIIISRILSTLFILVVGVAVGGGVVAYVLKNVESFKWSG